MARASKIIDGEIQIDPFMATLAAWISRAISGGESVKVSAITDKDPDYDAPKSDIQREKFHAMIGDIQKTGIITIPGRRIVMANYTPEKCKALLVMWFCNEIKELNDEKIKIPNPPESFDCPLTGETITIRPSTTKWGKKLTCVFVDWLYATGSMAGVRWSEKGLEAYELYREAQQ
jgi:hypothetical protein